MDINKVSQLSSSEDEKNHKDEHRFNEEKSFDYDKITDKIFLGTNMCCLMGYKEELLFKDIRADISLEKERIDNPHGVDYFLWLPVDDKHAPTEYQLELGVANLTFLVNNRIKVYVHCKNGHGRAPTLVIAYFISTSMNVQEAIDNVSIKRPSVHPTDEQLAALQKYEQKVSNNT